ncbi:hypothetical protein Tco_0719621 [Tanacetum coccineum]
MNRVTGIPDSLLISYYISGLKLHLQRELLVSKPTTLGDVFSLARIIEARFDDQAAPVAGTSAGLEANKVVNDGDDSESSGPVTPTSDSESSGEVKVLNWVQQSIDVESTYDNDARDQVSGLEMKVLVDGKQDEAKVVKVVLVAVEQNIDEPDVEGNGVIGVGVNENNKGVQYSVSTLHVLILLLERLNDQYIKKKKMEVAIQRRIWDPRIKIIFLDNTLRTRSPHTLEVVLLSRYYPQGSYQLVLSLRALIERSIHRLLFTGTYDNDARDQVSELEMKVLVDGKQDESKVVKVVVVAVEQNIDEPDVEGNGVIGVGVNENNKGVQYSVSTLHVLILLLERLNDQCIKKKKMEATIQRRIWDPEIKINFFRQHLEDKVISEGEKNFTPRRSKRACPSPHDKKIMPCRKAHLLEDKQIPSVGVFDEVYLAFGRHLEEIHVTWAHLEKKRTRLRTYTNISQDYVLKGWRRRHKIHVMSSQFIP